jgi:hypothetical protein
MRRSGVATEEQIYASRESHELGNVAGDDSCRAVAGGNGADSKNIVY